ncbi:MFS transporter [Nonomuraea sp. TT08I-71]|nr:MFS transporter [Nonomuraea sp. TT08I-71]
MSTRTDSAGTPAPTRAGRREWVGLALLALACLVVTMDLTVLLLAVPSLTQDLAPSATQLLWITDTYGFLMAGALVVMGALGDRLGRRRLLMTGAAGFITASVAASLATSPEMLIAARGLQGLAGAALLPSTMALVFGMFADGRQRQAALGMVMGSFALGAALGPLCGGVLLEVWSWRSVFVPNVPVGLVLLALAPRLLPEVRNAAAGRVDLASAALSVAGILAAVFAVKDIAQNGLSAVAVSVAVAGAAALVVFGARQRRLAQPLVDLASFRRPAFSTTLGANAVAMFVTFGTFFFTAQFLQLVVGLSPLGAGLWGLPPVVAMMIAAGGVVPKLAAKVRPAALLSSGMAVTAVGLLALSTVDASTGAPTVVALLLVVVVGLAPVSTISLNLAIGAAPPEQAGSVAGLGQAANELGGALGIAVLGTIGTVAYRRDVDGALEGLPADVAHQAGDTLGGAVALAGRLPDGVIDAARAAFAEGLGAAATVGAAVLLVTAAVTAVVLRGVPPMAEPAGKPGTTHDETAAAGDLASIA